MTSDARTEISCKKRSCASPPAFADYAKSVPCDSIALRETATFVCKAGIPAGFKPAAFEARRDISHGARMAGRPGVASLHVVPG